MISLEGVQAVCGVRAPAIATIYPFLVAAMEEYDIDTPGRMAMFIAQGAHESTSFTRLEEVAYGIAYEGRADLGNTQPGDGKLFKGRGVFQLTGRTNYAKCSQQCFGDSDLLTD